MGEGVDRFVQFYVSLVHNAHLYHPIRRGLSSAFKDTAALERIGLDAVRGCKKILYDASCYTSSKMLMQIKFNLITQIQIVYVFFLVELSIKITIVLCFELKKG